MKPARKEATRAVTVRLPESQWVALRETAAGASVPASALARQLLGHAVAALLRGDPPGD